MKLLINGVWHSKKLLKATLDAIIIDADLKYCPRLKTTLTVSPIKFWAFLISRVETLTKPAQG